MKYIGASAILRVLFSQPGETFSFTDRVVSSQLIEIEAYRAVDRARFVGVFDDRETAMRRKELSELLARIDLMPIHGAVVDRAKASFAVNVRALDAIHVAAAEIFAAEGEGDPLEFWTHDERQSLAAQSRGLDVRGI